MNVKLVTIESTVLSFSSGGSGVCPSKTYTKVNYYPVSIFLYNKLRYNELLVTKFDRSGQTWWTIDVSVFTGFGSSRLLGESTRVGFNDCVSEYSFVLPTTKVSLLYGY